MREALAVLTQSKLLHIYRLTSKCDCVCVQEEHGVVTCVGMLDTGSPNPNVMMSGAKDGTITVWDIRTQKPAIHMAVTNPGDDSAMVCLLSFLTAHLS